VLVLSRKRDEKILLKVNEQDIELTVVRIDNNKVRLGIQAEKNVTILRSELLDRQNNDPKVATA
jgi:carbon storage regulator